MLCALSQEQISTIKKALEEDDDRFKHYLKLLKEWMDCHSFIPQTYDKRMLPIFLRSCKYNLERTKHKIELYFIYKKRYPEAFSYSHFTERERKALQNVYFFESSNITSEGYRVGCFGFRSPDTSGCDMGVVTKLFSMFATYKANLDEINAGIVITVNLQNFTPTMAASMISPGFKIILDMVQKVYPFRVRGIYITAMPGFALPVANMIKMIFNEKIRSRMNMETGDELMKRSIPIDCLPQELGGTDGTIEGNSKNFLKLLDASESWFLEQENVQIVGDVPKELYVSHGIDEDLGTQGSFRKLDID